MSRPTLRVTPFGVLSTDGATIALHEADGRPRFVRDLAHYDAIVVGSEVWVACAGELVRLGRDGRERGRDRLACFESAGRFLQSAIAPNLPVWHGSAPFVVRLDGNHLRATERRGELVLAVADTRWLVWQQNQLQSWRAIGEAWRRNYAETGWQTIDLAIALEGRAVVLVRRSTTRDGELKLVIAATSDGAPTATIRLTTAEHLAIAGRRGLAIAGGGERLSVIDLRFGRWLRDVVIPPHATDIAVDESFTLIAWRTASGIEVTRTETLATAVTHDDDPRGAAIEPADFAPSAEASETETAEPSPPPLPPQPFPTEPLIRLAPTAKHAMATPSELARALEVRLGVIAARVALAIAKEWDGSRIVHPNPARPPFADEVDGLLQLTAGRATEELALAAARLRVAENVAANFDTTHGERTTHLALIARDYQLTPLALELLLAIAGPHLRGELARLYGILSNDPGRPLVDEFLIGRILGRPGDPTSLVALARELDGDRPLRRYGLVRLGAGQRPFAPLTIDPLVIRLLANQVADGEPDRHLRVRRADRTFDELEMPRELINTALRFLAVARDEPARIVVRGRTGSGRHALLAALGARAGRDLGLIDLATAPREPPRMIAVVEDALRRALLRGLLPCVDGFEAIASEDFDLRRQLLTAMAEHPGPLAVRLIHDAAIPLPPGYLLLDIPSGDERERARSWGTALSRHRIELSDPSELAARYRIGPGTIDRVCAEATQTPERPIDAAGWMRELDRGARQHLDNRLRTSATHVTRLASWSDIVLPDDVIDSLLELTARVRHRKTVYETWGFDRSISTARGITALFQGGPGTGKTMVAGVIARDLGLELYRVDVARITSKWIGETEKNLGALFDAAEEGQVMLLFDEADSLFGKRTEVKTSVDRYANMEVNYLLQRLDSFEGIAVLTTNFGTAIDPAFKRRLTYRMTFPFPDEEMREQLWRALIPAAVPVSGKLDFGSLSRRFRMSGGYIRNAALRAAFLAAEQGTALTHDLLERAIRMEFREIGKLAETGSLE